MDVHRCPDCRTYAGPAAADGGPAVCPYCRLPLDGPEVAELRALDAELAAVEGRRAVLHQRRAVLVGALRARRAVTSPAFAGAAPGGEAPPRSAQNVLLALGGLLIVVAGLVFTLVSWGRFGIGGRAAVLTGLTVLVLAAPLAARRRGLDATAETASAVGLALVLLDAYAARAADLGGLLRADGAAYWAAVTALAALGAAAYGRLTRSALMPYAALLLLHWASPLAAAALHTDGTGLAYCLLAGAVLDLAVAAAVRMPAALVAAGVWTAAACGSAAVAAYGCDAYGPALRACVPLLSAAALALAAARSRRLPPGASSAAAALGALSLIAAAAVPSRLALPTPWAPLSAAAPAALLTALALLHLPPPPSKDTHLPAPPPSRGSGEVVAGQLSGGGSGPNRPSGEALPGQPSNDNSGPNQPSGEALPGQRAGDNSGPSRPSGEGLPGEALSGQPWGGGSRPGRGSGEGLPRYPSRGGSGPGRGSGEGGAGQLSGGGSWLAGWGLRSGWGGVFGAGGAVLGGVGLVAVPQFLRGLGRLAVGGVVPVVAALLAAVLAGAAVRFVQVSTGLRCAAVLAAVAAVVTVPLAAGLPYPAQVATAGLAAVGAGVHLLRRPAANPAPQLCALLAPSALALAWSLPYDAAALTVWAAAAVLAGCLAAGGRIPFPAGAFAVCALAYEAGRAATAAGLPLHLAAFAVLGVAVATVPVAARLGGQVSYAVESSGYAVGAVAVAATAGHPGALSLALAVAGAAGAGLALRAERRTAGAVGAAALLAGSSWVRLALAGVGAPEAYTVSVSAVLLALGWLRRRRDPALGSWAAYGPGLGFSLLPSLVAAWSDPHWLRPLLLGVVAVAVTLLGARHRLRAPLGLGGAVLVADAVHELAPTVVQSVGHLPHWLPVAGAGALLLYVGATYERRLLSAKRLRRGFHTLR